MKKVVALLTLLVVASAQAEVIATVNGFPIHKEEANGFLKVATKGKATYGKLNEKEKKILVERLAADKMVLVSSVKEISKAQRGQIIASYWLRLKASKLKVSDKEMKEAYNKNKKLFVDKDKKTVPFKDAKELIRGSLLQKKVVDKLMKGTKIVMGSKGLSKDFKTKKSSEGKNHKVESGNTLSGIATKHGITTNELRAANGMTAKDRLKVGQVLRIPQ